MAVPRDLHYNLTGDLYFLDALEELRGVFCAAGSHSAAKGGWRVSLLDTKSSQMTGNIKRST